MDKSHSLNQLTVIDLKNILRENKLKIGGNKAELIERVASKVGTQKVLEERKTKKSTKPRKTEKSPKASTITGHPEILLLTGQKDADLLILENLNDKDLLSFCLVNKEANRLCSINSFWLNRFIREYSKAAMKYKSPEKTWKKFYLQIVYYYNRYNNWECPMNEAAFEGEKDLVEFFISKGAKHWNDAMIFAAEGGHKDLVEFFISKGANDLVRGLNRAKFGGHKDLVDFFKQKM